MCADTYFQKRKRRTAKFFLILFLHRAELNRFRYLTYRQRKEWIQDMENMENAEKNEEKTVMELWTENMTDYWNTVFGLHSVNGNGNGNGKGPMKLASNTMKSCMTLWKTLSSAMMRPDAVASLPRAVGELPMIFLKMQQKEVDRFFQIQDHWIEKSENFAKLNRLMYMKTFV